METTTKRENKMSEHEKVIYDYREYVYVTYDEFREGGEICAGQEDDAWPSYEDCNIDMTVKSIHITNPGCLYLDKVKVKSFEEKPAKKPLEKGQEVYLVVVRYRTGDTFGNTCGAHHFEGIYLSEEEANEVVASVKNSSYKGDYKRWEGYFEALEDCYVETRELME